MSSTVLRMSTLFLRTLRQNPSDADVDSARLLQRAGYVRKAAPGIWTWLPLGLRVLERIEAVIREEMNAIGCQEVHFPALLPREPFEATKRWDEYGDNIFRLKDRHQADYLLAPTHEEMFTLLVADLYSSYKDLPVSLYQIQTKYRDEFRPRAGLIRGREFIMKDAYSFSVDEEGLRKAYEAERSAYERIFKRLELPYVMVHAMSGPMGGSASEEFLAPMPIGEDTFALAPSGKAWNVEALTTAPPAEKDFSNVETMCLQNTPKAATIAELVGVANERYPRIDGRKWEASDTLKLVALTLKHPQDDDHDSPWREVIAVGVPGNRVVDMKRLEAQFAPAELEEATPGDLAKHPELVKGYMGPMSVGPQSDAACPVRYFIDAHVANGSEWIIGGDQYEAHYFHAVYGRDFVADKVVEAVQVQNGDMSPDGSGPLSFERGVEIGQVFQLGLKYSQALGLQVLNEQGKNVPVWMGSYGIGVSRVLACIAEVHHDEKGLAWPSIIAPASVHILAAGKEEFIYRAAGFMAQELQQDGFDVLYDDRRNVSVGVKFKDAELIGVPIIVVVGREYANSSAVEVRTRDASDYYTVSPDDLSSVVRKLLDKQPL